jgi:hypothetical protein
MFVEKAIDALFLVVQEVERIKSERFELAQGRADPPPSVNGTPAKHIIGDDIKRTFDSIRNSSSPAKSIKDSQALAGQAPSFKEIKYVWGYKFLIPDESHSAISIPWL